MSVLSLEEARIIADATLVKGRETECLPLAVAVLDTGGHIKAVLSEPATAPSLFRAKR